MKILRGEKPQEYILEFSDDREFEAFFDVADRQGSFLLNQSSIPENAILRAASAGSPRSRRLKPLKIIKEANSCRIVLTEKLLTEPASAEPLAGESQAKREPVASTAEQIRSLTVTEKAMLAMKANLAERRVLMQDTNPKIQEFVLRNPRLTESEIAWMAKNPMSSIPTLLTIIQHKGWMSTDAIRQGIFTNPKTPAHIVLDRIPSLGAGDLIKMYHAKNLREDIRDAVQRQIKKRGIRVKGDRT